MAPVRPTRPSSTSTRDTRVAAELARVLVEEGLVGPTGAAYHLPGDVSGDGR